MTTDRPFRVNTKKARSAAAKAECAEELGALFSCMMVRKGGRRETKEFVVGRRQTSIGLSRPPFAHYFLLSPCFFLS